MAIKENATKLLDKVLTLLAKKQDGFIVLLSATDTYWQKRNKYVMKLGCKKIIDKVECALQN